MTQSWTSHTERFVARQTKSVGSDANTETVLVTAAAGTTGSSLVRQLGDHDVSVRAAALSEELGRDIEYVQVGMDDAREGMLDVGMPEALVDGYVELLEYFETGGGTEVDE